MVTGALLGFAMLVLVLMVFTRSGQPRVRRSGPNDSGYMFFGDGGGDSGCGGDSGGGSDGGGCGDGGGGGGD